MPLAQRARDRAPSLQNLPGEAAFVREAVISPDEGVLDDLGYDDVLRQIDLQRGAVPAGPTCAPWLREFPPPNLHCPWPAAHREVARDRAEPSPVSVPCAVALEASLHYPTQLAIRAEIAALQERAQSLAEENATWRRRWPMRLCTSAADAGSYYLSVYADVAMDPTAHSGLLQIRLTRVAFDRSPLSSSVPRRGCLRRGDSELFELRSSAAAPQLTSLGIAQVVPYYVDTPDNHLSSLTVRRGAPPTADSFDARVQYPELRVSMSACDVTTPQRWFLSLALDGSAAPSEARPPFQPAPPARRRRPSRGGGPGGVPAHCAPYRPPIRLSAHPPIPPCPRPPLHVRA